MCDIKIKKKSIFLSFFVYCGIIWSKSRLPDQSSNRGSHLKHSSPLEAMRKALMHKQISRLVGPIGR